MTEIGNHLWQSTLFAGAAGAQIRLAGPGDGESSSPTLLTALPEQLGLFLELKNVMTEIILIESTEKPTEN